MKNQICKNCKFWKSPHEGMWQSEEWGTCNKIFGGSAVVLCEGCVEISNRVSDPEIVTLESFGCNQFKKNNDQ